MSDTKRERPEVKFFGFDHVKFYVSNAKQAADFYITRFGFTRLAYKGLETGDRDFATHVIRQNDIIFSFVSSYNPVENDLTKHVSIHGDGVRDVALSVDNAKLAYETAVKEGATGVVEPKEITDEDGTIVTATIKTYGDTHHTFIDRTKYKGKFLPGFKITEEEDVFANFTPPIALDFIDHVVGNQPDNEMLPVVEWYEKTLKFHRFWSVDDSVIHTEYSSLRSIVMTDYDEVVKLPINEPANGKRKSQIQEYVDYYGGGGVQHIALNTKDVIAAVENLRKRGVRFLSVPKSYYDDLRKRLGESSTQVKEDLDIIEKNHILVDFDEKGYLLQIFSSNCQDRPTLFLEIIQRNNHNGFGAGNFKALFEAIEREQEVRGNL